MPNSIAKTNKALWLPPKPKEAIAGPGHKPANPHPTPKSGSQYQITINVRLWLSWKLFCIDRLSTFCKLAKQETWVSSRHPLQRQEWDPNFQKNQANLELLRYLSFLIIRDQPQRVTQSKTQLNVSLYSSP